MKTVRLNADVDAELVKRLRHLLIEEQITFSKWLRRQIDEYIEKHEPKREKGGKR